MKKYFAFVAIATTAVIVFTNCGSSKKATAAAPPKMNYESNVQAIVTANCAPCHIPAKGGNKRAYDNFANVKSDIDEIIRRIEMHPGERGFMPQKRARLSDSTIAIVKQWKADGLLEK